MCGILGIWDTNGQAVNTNDLVRATNLLRHRGPDAEGFLCANSQQRTWQEGVLPSSQEWDLAFGFRRLAILDLSPAGHQPMCTRDGSLWIVFNGEIYNYLELRLELQAQGFDFYTGTDTEVILAAYQQWGKSCLERFNGMWAFAIWDTREKLLFCARDRFGIKPFYYSWKDGKFAFASEIKALFHLYPMTREPNDPLIYDYLSFNLLDHSDETFFKGVFQIPPGHSLTIKNSEKYLHQYWDLDFQKRASPESDRSSSQIFYDLFEDAVRVHLRSDVPIGSCLSGGLDSSSIVCVANHLLFEDRVLDPALVGEQQKTFSSCFDDPRFDERQYIEQVLEVTNAEANYVFPASRELLEELPRLIWHQDEPFGSLSIYAQWCVMRAAQERGVRVTLDGQGGDELLAGYLGYFDYFWGGLLRRGAIRNMVGEWKNYHSRFAASYLSIAARTLRSFMPAKILRIARHFRRGGGFGTHVFGIHPDFGSQYVDRELENLPHGMDPFNGTLYTNLRRLSLPKLLHYEDRNSMAFSIEARVPFLDYRLVEFAFSLPDQEKIDNAVTKVILRDSMRGILPESIRTRTDKMGFVTPEKVWLGQDMHAWVTELITSPSFANRPYFNVPAIQRGMAQHAAGTIDLTGLAWRWLNLELWLRQMIEGPVTSP